MSKMKTKWYFEILSIISYFYKVNLKYFQMCVIVQGFRMQKKSARGKLFQKFSLSPW
jgi:hypothetical protein